MANRKAKTPVSPPPAGNAQAGVSAVPQGPENVEDRVRRLENAVAELHNTRQLEERIVERVVARILRKPVEARREPTEIVVEPARTLLPVPLGLPAEPVQREASRRSRPQPSIGFLSEIRAIIAMYFDPRYRLSWVGRAAPVVAGVLMFFFWFFLNKFWIVGPLLDKVLDIGLILVTYKILAHEARRYLEMVS